MASKDLLSKKGTVTNLSSCIRAFESTFNALLKMYPLAAASVEMLCGHQ